jgi:hypothetical protein
MRMNLSKMELENLLQELLSLTVAQPEQGKITGQRIRQLRINYNSKVVRRSLLRLL